MGIILDITPEEVIALNEQLKTENEELKEHLVNTLARISWLENQLFGSKSEKLDPNQTELFDEGVEMGKPEPPVDESADELEEQKSNDENKPKTTRKKKSEIYPTNLRVVEVERIKPAEVEANPELYKKVGEREHDLLHHQRAELYWERRVTEQYVRIDDKEAPPVTAPAPAPSIKGASITPEFAAQLVIAKYCDHLPHYRQAGIWKREQDINLSRKTLNKWTHAIAEHLKAIAQAIGRELRMADVIQLDETPIKYLKPGNRKTKKGYYWIMRNPQTGEVYFHWDTTRGNDGLKRTLGGDDTSELVDFTGTIQCDGYGSYPSIAGKNVGIALGGCLAHIRRYFLKDESFTMLAWGKEFTRKIQSLYQIERELREANAPPDVRKRVRQEKAKPIIKELKETLITQKPNYRSSTILGVAINYALGQWESFEHYLEEGRLEIDNNGVENAVRPTKLGAKNHLFIGSAEAGENSAILYTLVENCRALGLNPRDYLICAIKGRAKNINPAELTPAKLSRQFNNTQNQVA